MKKIIHIRVAFVFIVFAIVQWNDPDPLLWILLYIYVAFCILMFVFTEKSKYPLLIGVIICLIISVSYIPDVLNWFKDGMPSIVGSMKAENLYIGLVREFFGALLALVTFIIYYFLEKKRL